MSRKINILEQYKGLPREVYILFFSRMVNSIGSFVSPLLALILTDKIGMSKSLAGEFITLLFIFSAPGMLIGGKLVDKIGRKKVIIIFQGLAALIFVICGFLKPDIRLAYTLMLAPILAAFCMPAHDAMIADITTPKNRKEAYSLLYMGHNLGFAIGPILGGLLYENYLSWVFIGDAITTFVSLILVLIFVKETLNKGKEQSANRELEKEEKGNTLVVLKKRPILIIYAFILCIYNLGYVQWGFALPMQMKDIFGILGAKYYGIISSFNGIVVIISTAFVVKGTSKMNILKVISFGGILYSISFLIFSFANHISLFLLSIGILTLGEVIIWVNSAAFIANNTPSSHRGRINSIVTMIYGLGTAMGPYIMGIILTNTTINAAWIIISIMVLLSAIFMRNLKKFFNING